MSIRHLIILSAAALLGGCSTVSDMFSSGPAPVKPAELTDFKATTGMARMWEAQAGAAGRYAFSPATDGAAVYAAGSEGRLVKLDLASGKEVWRIDTGAPLSGGVGVGDGLALVGTAKGELLAYKTADGALAWKAKLSGEILTPPVAGEGMAAARGNDGKVWLLDSGNGKVRWVQSRTLPALTLRDQSHLMLTGIALYAGHAGGRFSAYALNNGAPVWEGNIGLPKGVTELERISDVTGPAAVDDRMVCAAGYQGRVACFDRISGNALWGRELSSLRGVDMDERYVYAVNDKGAVLAYSKDKGINPWKQDKLRDRKLSSPLAVAAKYVAVGDFQGHIHLLSSGEGVFTARAATDGSAINGVMIPLKAGLVAQTANGGIFAFKID